jgi:hypothetical protein
MKSFLSLFVVLGVAACGKIPDPERPAVGQATIRAIHDDGISVAGATVVHTQPDGTLIAQTTLAADGSATLDVTEGDIVHVGWMETDATGLQSKRLYSIVHIEPGDDVRLNDPPFRGDMDVASVTVQVPTLPMNASKAEIFAGGVCSGVIDSPTVLTTTVPLRTSCLNANGEVTLVAQAQDANGLTVAQTVLVDIVPANGQTLVMPAWQTPSSGRVSFTMIHAPDGATEAVGTIIFGRNNLGYERFGFSGPASNPGMLTVQPALGYVDGILRIAAVTFPDAADPSLIDGEVSMLAKEPYSDDGQGASFTADLFEAMPRIYGAKYAATDGTFEWLVQSASDEQTARLTNADVVRAILPWADQNVLNVWIVLMPGSIGSPLHLDVHNLSVFTPASAMGTLPFRVEAFEIDALENYQAVKNQLGANFSPIFESLPELQGIRAFSGK